MAEKKITVIPNLKAEKLIQKFCLMFHGLCFKTFNIKQLLCLMFYVSCVMLTSNITHLTLNNFSKYSLNTVRIYSLQ